jgi:hypothetical protein
MTPQKLAVARRVLAEGPAEAVVAQTSGVCCAAANANRTTATRH